MSDPRLEIVEWPDELGHILEHLDWASHRDFVEFPTDSGRTMRRQRTTPVRVLKGTVTLSQGERTALDRFFVTSQGRHFSFADPDTGATIYATFGKPPFVRQQSIVVGGDTTYEIEIVLQDTTRLIEQALEHGVVTRS